MDHDGKQKKAQQSAKPLDLSTPDEERRKERRQRRHRSSSGSDRRERKSSTSSSKPSSQRSRAQDSMKERRRIKGKTNDNETEILWHRNRPSSSKEHRSSPPSSSRRSRTNDPNKTKSRRRKSKDDLLNISSETEILWHRNGPSKITTTEKKPPTKPSSVSSLSAGAYMPAHLKVQSSPQSKPIDRQAAAARLSNLVREKAQSERSERRIAPELGETVDMAKPPRTPHRKTRLPPRKSKSSDAISTNYYWQREPSTKKQVIDSQSSDRSSLNKDSIALIAQKLQRTNEKEQNMLDAVSTLRGRRMPKGRGRTGSASPRTSLERQQPVETASSSKPNPAAKRRERSRRSVSRDGARVEDGSEVKSKADSGHSRDGKAQKDNGKSKRRSESASRHRSKATRSASSESQRSRKPPRKSSSFGAGSKRRSRRREAIEDDTFSTAETVVISNR